MVQGHIKWAGKLGKIMCAEYIIHRVCDILLTVHVLNDELWNPGMDPWEIWKLWTSGLSPSMVDRGQRIRSNR